MALAPVTFTWRGRNALTIGLLAFVCGLAAWVAVTPDAAPGMRRFALWCLSPAIMVAALPVLLDPRTTLTVDAHAITYRWFWRERVFPRGTVRCVLIDGGGEDEFAWIVTTEGERVAVSSLVYQADTLRTALAAHGYGVIPS